MLKALRSKKTAKKIWIVLAIVIIPAFCLWGIGSALRNRGKSMYLGKISGKSISLQEYLRNYKAIRNQYLIQLGQEQLAKLEKYLNLEAQTWDRIILLIEAKRRGIRVSNKEVIDSIKQYPFFQRDGKFDPALYREVITYIFRTKPRTFEEEIRDNLTIAKLYQEITRQVALEKEEIRNAYIKDNEQISLDYICTSSEDFLPEVSIEEQELLEYYNKHSKEFNKPLSFNLEYITIENDKAVIGEITQLINQGVGLQEIAKKMGLELKETGFFSLNEPIPHIGWSTEISKILPELKPGDEAWPQPIQVDVNTVYFLQLKQRRDPYVLPFEEVKDKVSSRLRHQKASNMAKEKLDACRSQIETYGFTESAKRLNLKTGTTELFKRRGYVNGLGDSDIFFEAVLDLEEKQTSKILQTTSGFCIVKLNQHILPDEKKYQQEKESFARRLLEQKKQNFFTQFLVELKNKPRTYIRYTGQILPKSR